MGGKDIGVVRRFAAKRETRGLGRQCFYSPLLDLILHLRVEYKTEAYREEEGTRKVSLLPALYLPRHLQTCRHTGDLRRYHLDNIKSRREAQ